MQKALTKLQLLLTVGQSRQGLGWDPQVRIQFDRVHFGVFSTPCFAPPAFSSDWGWSAGGAKTWQTLFSPKSSQLTGRGRRQGSKNVIDTFLLWMGVPTYLMDKRMGLTPLPPLWTMLKKAAQLVSRDIPKFLMSDAAQSERFLGLPNQSFSGYQVVGWSPKCFTFGYSFIV